MIFLKVLDPGLPNQLGDPKRRQNGGKKPGKHKKGKQNLLNHEPTITLVRLATRIHHGP